MKVTSVLRQSASASNAEYFEQLPQILKNFFTKHSPATATTYSQKPTFTNDPTANPFLPNKHPVTLKYHSPQYSLRRQSVLYKTAKMYGIEDLLPSLNNKKFFEDKYTTKSFMKGVLRPKGHKHELSKESRQEAIKKAMETMETTIAKVKGSKYKKKMEKKREEEKKWY
ncbi:mitochondrial 54S ribosomal protein YmL25 [Saccharomycopsis crataegensis]|uniref:Mitochondrial 54S ribosomal protein YmL25 n=1 Tax=Saccharomycopsis crataegensis TaxID=43959 RepID=A0AAV5QS43_9ASCO|nr:mitochondrial 54S ribosomal protein YmL25 [Saccharomycopsis crataegensis]